MRTLTQDLQYFGVACNRYIWSLMNMKIFCRRAFSFSHFILIARFLLNEPFIDNNLSTCVCARSKRSVHTAYYRKRWRSVSLCRMTVEKANFFSSKDWTVHDAEAKRICFDAKGGSFSFLILIKIVRALDVICFQRFIDRFDLLDKFRIERCCELEPLYLLAWVVIWKRVRKDQTNRIFLPISWFIILTISLRWTSGMRINICLQWNLLKVGWISYVCLK